MADALITFDADSVGFWVDGGAGTGAEAAGKGNPGDGYWTETYSGGAAEFLQRYIISVRVYKSNPEGPDSGFATINSLGVDWYVDTDSDPILILTATPFGESATQFFTYTQGTWKSERKNTDTEYTSIPYVTFNMTAAFTVSNPTGEIRFDNLYVDGSSISSCNFAVSLDSNDICSDVKRASIDIGFSGPHQQVAAAGRATIVLDNTSKEYSPGNTGGSLADSLKPRKNITITVPYNGTDYTIFNGYVDQIKPTAGENLERECTIEAIDLAGLLYDTSVDAQIDLQEDQRTDQLISSLVNSVISPSSTDYDVGNTTIPYAGDTWGKNTSVMSAISDVTRSEYGRFYVVSDGEVRFDNRDFVTALQYTQTSKGTFSEDDQSHLRYTFDLRRTYNQIEVSIREAGEASSTSVLYSAYLPVFVPANGTKTIYGRIKNTDGDAGSATTITTPAQGTDYAAYTGVNKLTDTLVTSNVSMSASRDGTQVEITLTNDNTFSVYFHDIQVRGTALENANETIVKRSDATSQAAYGVRQLAYSAPYLTTSAAQDIADYMIAQFGDPLGVAGEITFHLHNQQYELANGAIALDLDLRDRLEVTDAQTGLDAQTHFIYRIRHELRDAGLYHRMSIALEAANPNVPGVLDNSEYAKIDTMILGA